MKSYARIDAGVVVEIIRPMHDEEGNEASIDDRYTREFVATLVDITDLIPMPSEHWAYADGAFTASAS
jgi:hypothetical protein